MRALWMCGLLALGCGDGGSAAPAGPADAVVDVDAARVDAAPVDAAPVDAAPDAQAVDAAVADAARTRRPRRHARRGQTTARAPHRHPPLRLPRGRGRSGHHSALAPLRGGSRSGGWRSGAVRGSRRARLPVVLRRP
ncbi:MAG: hypothetical protein R3F43_02610 [bacterium]